MKAHLRGPLIAVAVAALLGAAFWWVSRPRPVPVVLKAASPGRVEATLSNTRAGTVEACQRTKLSTILGGRIEILNVKEGDRVKKGQLLLKLWNDDQKAQQTLADAQLELSRRRVAEACTVAASARREADRTAKLRHDGFVSEAKEDAARTEAEAKEAACATARADVDQAKAKLAAVRVEQGRVSLVAPFDGTVAKIVGEVGEYSTPSPPGVPTPPAIDLIDDSCLYVKAPMDEVDAPKIRPGQTVRIRIDAFPGRNFPGRVKRVAPYVTAVEKQSRTVDVEVDFGKPDEAGGLLVGYSADVEIVLESKENALRAPTAAIQEGGRVLVLKDGLLEERRVKAGLSNWEYTEVLEGLASGDRIVVSLEKEGVKAGVHAMPDEKASAK
ncbi:MAG: efflux RND transporter periplasmic adaptor subunit [Candidatus Nitricoxidivorans perseverans]|uniref:Efflux RND transporter periplasmic adaptor subunit n=1 Tax=Candidatus Nitricoxidivorans perseverans TaxID=2975601 RepID=A0AA49FJ56_9PROT|nr:MAG: efflux RND transporter periplasmic adaptor subunit [Candidatus Nitricoxidivorans perseverans]